MKTNIIDLFSEFREYLLHPAQDPSIKGQTVRQTLCGAVATVMDITVLQFLVMLGANAYLATGLGFFIGMIVNFCLTRCYAFADRQADHLGSDFVLYAMSNGCGLLIAEACILFFHGFFDLSPLWAKLLSVPIVFAWSLLASRLIFHGKYRAMRDNFLARRKKEKL